MVVLFELLIRVNERSVTAAIAIKNSLVFMIFYLSLENYSTTPLPVPLVVPLGLTTSSVQEDITVLTKNKNVMM
jgi:hypothetical protein